MNDEDAQDERDHAARQLEVERSFNNALAKSGVVLEYLDVTTATRVAFEFFRDASFDWIIAEEDENSTCNVSTEFDYAPAAPANPLIALFTRPRLGPLEAIRLCFQRDIASAEYDVISFSLELKFAPDGLERLEVMDTYADEFDSFEEFARAVLTHPSLARLAALQPRSVSMSTE
jgi:hypothetical protein